ncbi:ABC-type transport system, involved in lipoprotein release, permease component [Anaerovirgula multivorans]|uniref:ABC-type transport system, involved in lipoprotein release, permease component n=1 Tax=Anaerovirgula multivorans TaxID=312168 RepID=A0A239JUK0_9FIRM|nr:ABC transporter permease [Anaerovirgula multivorans]SNT09465.1 ABC-type transport system, involved in lipoprotein release, permease component [Anaerovirgula multivorans]
MNNLDLLKMALGNLWKRKTRTFLTILGVIIGTSSIVIMLSLGIAMDRSFQEQLSQMGNLNMIEIHNYGYYDDSMDSRQSKKVSLNDQAVASFKQIPGVEAVMATKRAHYKMGVGRMVGYVSVIGIDPNVMEAFDFKIDQGRLLLSTDKDAMVFGKNVPMDFYNPRLRNSYDYRRGSNGNTVDLISNSLILTSDMSYGETRNNRIEEDSKYTPPKPHNVKGVGILAESFSEKDYYAYMNITALEKIIEEDRRANRQDSSSRNRGRDTNKYETISVKVKDMNDVEKVQETIKAMGFQTYSLTDMLKSMKETSAKMQAILGGIGAVSLFVAAIGITNTMIMSIYERTREIGVMKVLGANLPDIRKLFLVEAGIIGFCGGIAGLVLSYTVSFGLNKIGRGFLGSMGGTTGMSVIPIELAIAAVLFATFIGIVSGYSPARRAMNLSALEAIKTE